MTATASNAMPRWAQALENYIAEVNKRIDRFESRYHDGETDTNVGADETDTLPRQRQAIPPTRNRDLDQGRINMSTSGQRREIAKGSLADDLQNGVNELNGAGQRVDALYRQTAALFRRMSYQPTADERNAIAAARHRADSVYARLGRSVPEYMPGESPSGYRKRLAHGLREFSPQLRHTNMDAVPDSALGAVEDRVYQDAMEAANKPAANPHGTLRPRSYIGPTGHLTTEYYGDPLAWMAPFMAPGARMRLNRQIAK